MTLSAEAEREREEIVCEQEERDVMLEELRELRGQRETDLADYRHIMAASALLQKAKESLTARYADPIRAGFCRYWEMITGISASGVYVDANTKVTVEEKGKQRGRKGGRKRWRKNYHWMATPFGGSVVKNLAAMQETQETWV